MGSDSDFGRGDADDTVVAALLGLDSVTGGGKSGIEGIDVGPGRSNDGGEVIGVVMLDRSGEAGCPDLL
jgi:hypothetical protein